MKARFVRESIIDEKQETENPYVWKDNKINPLIRIKIIDILDEKKIEYKNVFIIGSITGKFWTQESDIDTTVVSSIDDDVLTAYRKVARIMNERNFFGPFPINFFFRNDAPENILPLADGVYDLLQDKWLKEPLEADEVEEALKNPKKLAEIIARRLDIELDDISESVEEIVKNYDTGNFDLEDHLDTLKLELEDYVNALDAVHKKRNESFSNILERDDLQKAIKYRSPNLLPWNIIYKFLTKWLYYKWYTIFKDATKDEEMKKDEAKKLFRKFVRYWI